VARRVVWSEPAWFDLEEIVDYIADDAPQAAARFYRQARDASRSLVTLADRGRRLEELDEPGLREIPVGSYRLIYEVIDGTVEIHALIHGARDLDMLWRRRGR
jgi:toxin ParE1/3/4